MRKTLYDYVTESGIATPVAAAKAKEYAASQGVSPQKALIDTAAVTEESLLKLLGSIYRYKTVTSLKNVKTDKDLLPRFDTETLISLKMLPLRCEKMFTVAIANPNNTLAVEDYIREITGDRNIKIEYILISENVFTRYINAGRQNTVAISYDLDSIEDVTADSTVYDINDSDNSVIISVVNKIFTEAVRMKASDIHIEPFVQKTRVRFRIDGILQVVSQMPKKAHNQLVGRIKTMANMDVNNTRLPQGGRIRLKLNNAEIDMRVSTLPAVHGEKITIRLLDQNSMDFNIGMMSFSNQAEKRFMNVIEKPSGIVLVTGPTGSGKSSSLYAVISHLNDTQRCIVTLEQPVEYRIDGIVQVQIDEAGGLTFDKVLREVLRQDPDTILIGEIRDEQTARTAVQASNTGHQVFSTLHTNSAASSVMRLIEMGIEPFLVSTTLNAVVNQRLVRRICPECKYEYEMQPDSQYAKLFGQDQKVKLYRGTGCDECNGTGYKGRIAVLELLVVDDNIRKALAENATTQEIEKIAIRGGMRTLVQDGISKALSGFTTLDEIHRIIHFDNL